jgi:ABC-2 type transport system ATP-binding protein
MVGYLGLNGSGKSTSLKMMMGVLVPTSGRVEVSGIVPWRKRIELAKKIGVVFGHRTGLWWDLPVADSFILLRHLYGVPRSVYDDMLSRLSDVLDLHEYWQTPVRQLSLGQRMRVELATAFLHRPEILFLDEPTIGLDFLAKDRVRDFISTVNRDFGTTVILTSHDLADIEYLCKRVIFIDRGKIQFDGTIEHLAETYGGEREIDVTFANPITVGPLLDRVSVTWKGQVAVFRLPTATDVTRFISNLSEYGEITDVSVRRVGLEVVLRNLHLSNRPPQENKVGPS